MQSRFRAGLNSALPSNQRLADASRPLRRAAPRCVHEVCLKEEISVAGCRRLVYGEESDKQNRTIVVLGAAGAGKSTLIDGMMNHILGVEWKDSFRFKLVDEAQSQTSEVTVYKLNHQDGFKIDHSLTIIDTPGFGDTERDEKIVEHLRNLFNDQLGVREVDAVCFVAPAALARLTPAHEYMFDSVLSIFGKDMAENVRVLVTFADGGRPPVLEAINAAGVPCPQTEDGLPAHFKFNNSALFADNRSSSSGSKSEDDDDDGGFDEMFWDVGTKSMKRFFAALNLMAESRVERERLDNLAKNLEEQVELGMMKLKEIKQTKEKLREHEAEKFGFETSVKKSVHEDVSGSGNYLSVCRRCRVTCHGPCRIPSDGQKIQCWMMGPTGRCTRCPGKCYSDQHFSKKSRCDSEEVREVHRVNEQETGGAMRRLIQQRVAEYKHVQAEVATLIASYAKRLFRPDETAATPRRSAAENIDVLIEGERSEAKLGWKRRVCSLMTTREKAEDATEEEGEVIGFIASERSGHDTETKRPRLEQDRQTPARTKTTPRRGRD